MVTPEQTPPRQGWDAFPLANEQSLDDDRWFKGYFHLSAGWTRDFGELLRREYAVRALGPVRGKRILDVACGCGLYMVPLAKLGAEVAGQDLSEHYVSEARKNLGRHGVSGELQLGDATRLQFESDTFDGVISGDFVEHIGTDVKRAFLAEVFRVLKPGGVLVIKTPNLTYLRVCSWSKRLFAVAKGQSPFQIHIAHIHNNPDNEHHGLTTFAELRELLNEGMFLPPEFVRHPLTKRLLPSVLRRVLPELPIVWPLFTSDLIAVTRKPIFLGLFP